MTKRYFAYGSNLNQNDLDEWQVNLQNPMPKRLDDYRLGFTRHTDNRKGGVADIIKDEKSFCWGVIFDVNSNDWPILDEKEGVLSNAYKQLYLSDDVYTYTVVKKCCFVQPHQDYLNLIIEGARQHKLPESWIRHLESFRSCHP